MNSSRICGGAVLLSVLSAALIVTHSSGSQPVQYNHAIHAGELAIDCVDCHTTASTGSRASIPNIELCSGCHMDTEAENVNSRIVAQYAERGEAIRWVQVHQVPDYAYFSHRRHVKLAGLPCEDCHGDVSQMQTPFLQPFVTMDMEWCMGCHEQRGVSSDCYTCHR